MDLYKDIQDFHVKFGLNRPEKPSDIDRETFMFRTEFMAEELDEYVKAYIRMPDNDRGADLLDALVDLVYVTIGTAYVHGFDFNAAWERVHKANMAKVRATSASESKRGSTLDVVKPNGWTAPVLNDLAWDV